MASKPHEECIECDGTGVIKLPQVGSNYQSTAAIQTTEEANEGPKEDACACAEAVAMQVRQRSQTGLEKYGVSCADSPLKAIEWLQHLQEELLDAAVYIERLKQEASFGPEGAGGERSAEEGGTTDARSGRLNR